MKLKKLKTDVEEIAPVVPPQAEIIEADLYKRSYFGPDVPTLELECWEEELSEAQLQAYKNADEEYKSIQNKLDVIVKDTGGEIVYNGDQFTAYQLLGKQPVLKDLERQSADIIRSRSRSLSICKEKESKGKRGRPRKNREEDRDYSPSSDRGKSPELRHKKKKKEKERKKDDKKRDDEKEVTKTKDKTLAPSNVHSVVTNVRPSEATAVGGLLTGSATKTTAIVDLTKDDGNKNVADSREVSFNKLQVCDRLWFQDDLKRPFPEHKEILIKIIPKIPAKNTKLCNTCVQALNKKNIPSMSTFNGFKYPDVPQHLPPLDLVSE
ncbi:unnamed protein product [Euphydryas editha]|uniref:Uncharacterized protein n=1 Tax=Euphydryas editha TaxID=104508 RepID=A0AAU9UY97_EUPED|nr:unnamed protein product [Euphydryas editha]